MFEIWIVWNLNTTQMTELTLELTLINSTVWILCVLERIYEKPESSPKVTMLKKEENLSSLIFICAVRTLWKELAVPMLLNLMPTVSQIKASKHSKLLVILENCLVIGLCLSLLSFEKKLTEINNLASCLNIA